MNGQSSSGRGGGVGGGVGEAREERGRRAVHAGVGALRREDHRDEQLEVVLELERDPDVRHGAREPVDDLDRARALLGRRRPPPRSGGIAEGC